MVFCLKSSNQRFIIVLIIVLNTLDTIYHTTKPQTKLKKLFENDLKYCDKCFQTQIPNCIKILNLIEEEEEEGFDLSHILPLIPQIKIPQITCKRQNNLIKLKNSNQKIITKTFSHKEIVSLITTLNKEEIKKEFIQQIENLQGMQYAPLKTLDKFINHLQHYHKEIAEITLWLYMLINTQTILLPVLYQKNFPVPQIYEKCGFTIFQEHAGRDLNQFLKADFKLKVQISQQLLEAALKFSYGFNNYRIYITDLTADNIVYDVQRNRLTFIDLDTIFVVDSTQAIYKSKIHKHQYIECTGCFAYSANDIALYNISDINVYSACQFLREDLYGDLAKGFLYPIPHQIINKYSNLKHLINKCVDCPDSICRERLTTAAELIKVFQQINEDYKKEDNC